MLTDMSKNHVIGDNRSDPKHPEKCWWNYIIYGAFIYGAPFCHWAFLDGAF